MENKSKNASGAPNTPLHIAEQILRGIYKINAILLVMVSLIMFSLMCVQVFIRYIVNGDLRAMEEYIYFFLLWLTMLGAANAVFENSHMRSDTLTSLIKNKRLLNTFMIVVDFVEVALYMLFAYYAYLYLLDCIELPSYSHIWHLPKLLGQSSVFYAGGMMTLFGLYHFVVNLQFRIRAWKAYHSGVLGKYDEAERLLKAGD